MVDGGTVLGVCLVVALVMCVVLPIWVIGDAVVHDKRYGSGILLDKYEADGTYYTVWPTEALKVEPKIYPALNVGQQYGYYTTDGFVVDVWVSYDQGF